MRVGYSGFLKNVSVQTPAKVTTEGTENSNATVNEIKIIQHVPLYIHVHMMNAIKSLVFILFYIETTQPSFKCRNGKTGRENGTDANAVLHARVRYPHIHTSSMNIRNTLF